MKKELKNVTIEEIREAIEIGNDLIANNKFDEIKKQEEKIADMVRNYNTILRQRQYDEWLKESAPFKVAFMQGYITQVSANLIEAKANEKAKFAESEKERLVDVEEFVKYAGDKDKVIVADKYWGVYCEAIAYQMAAHTAKEIGADLKRFEELYAVGNDAKKEIEEGKISVSAKAIKATVEKAFAKMLGEDIKDVLPNKNDLAFIRVACGGLNRQNQVKIPTRKTMVKIFTVMAYTKLNGLQYEVALKEKA